MQMLHLSFLNKIKTINGMAQLHMAQQKNKPRSRIHKVQLPGQYLETLAKGILAWVGTLSIVGGLWVIAHFLFQR